MKTLPLTVQNYLAIDRALVAFLHNEKVWKDGDRGAMSIEGSVILAPPGGAGVVGASDPMLDTNELSGKQRQSFRENTSKIWGLLRQARVFDLHPATYGTIYHEVDVYTTEALHGRKWVPGIIPDAGDPGDIPEGFDPVAYVKCLCDNGANLPLPEKVAFPIMFLGYGNGIGLTEVQYGWRFNRRMAEDGVAGALLVGHLIDSVGGNVIEFLTVLDRKTGETHARFFPLADKREWLAPETLAPWTIGALIRLINGYRRFVVQDSSLFYQMEYKAHAKKRWNHRKAVPPPFYTLHLKDETVRENARGTVAHYRKANAPEHRFDVRGHERIRATRGSLPLDDKLRRILTKRKYRIFTVEDLDEETWRLLAERRMPGKRPGEWVAIKKSWVSNYEKGPEGAPFIPALRQVPKRRRAV